MRAKDKEHCEGGTRNSWRYGKRTDGMDEQGQCEGKTRNRGVEGQGAMNGRKGQGTFGGKDKELEEEGTKNNVREGRGAVGVKDMEQC